MKIARVKKGFSQKEVADAIGVSPKSYSFYEDGSRNPKIDKVKKLIKFLDLAGTNVPTKEVPKAEFSIDELALQLVTVRELINLMAKVYNKPTEEIEAILKEKAALKKEELIKAFSF